jgi:hypothetical protein
MAISDMISKGNIWTGIAIGAGLLAAPVVIPAVASVARPLLKAVIKGGYMLYEYGREMVAEVTELTEDLFVEAKAEFEAGVTEVQAGLTGAMQAVDVRHGSKKASTANLKKGLSGILRKGRSSD